MCLPPRLLQEVTACSFTASTMEAVVKASEAARQFLLQQGAGERRAGLLALSIEEMGGNIIRWGFGDGKNHIIDIRVVKGDNLWTLRLRDNCTRFNPKEWLALHGDADKLKNFGIRTVCGLAREVRYSSTLGMNYLLIELA